MNTPAEILQIWIGNGVKKANLPVFKMILLGMAASFSSETCSPSRSKISSEAR